MKKVTLENLFYYMDKFRGFLINERKMKENTVSSYISDLNKFFEFCREDGYMQTDSIEEAFNSYIDNLRSLDKSPSTISRNIASLRKMSRYLKDKGIIDRNPTKGVSYEKSIKTADDDFTVLSVDEIDKLIECTKDGSIKGYRDEAILEIMYACGIKVSELINLCTGDLSLNEGYITVRSGNLRYVPIYKGAAKAINTYITKARKYLVGKKKINNLFLNRNGEPLSRQGVWKILKSCGERAGIEKEITPHLIRRSMAVHLLENGANIFDVQAILGHKNVNLTKKYLNNFKPSVTQAYKKAHPKA